MGSRSSSGWYHRPVHGVFVIAHYVNLPILGINAAPPGIVQKAGRIRLSSATTCGGLVRQHVGIGRTPLAIPRSVNKPGGFIQIDILQPNGSTGSDYGTQVEDVPEEIHVHIQQSIRTRSCDGYRTAGRAEELNGKTHARNAVLNTKHVLIQHRVKRHFAGAVGSPCSGLLRGNEPGQCTGSIMRCGKEGLVAERIRGCIQQGVGQRTGVVAPKLGGVRIKPRHNGLRDEEVQRVIIVHVSSVIRTRTTVEGVHRIVVVSKVDELAERHEWNEQQ
ncbi:MAG: hypothetical protein F6K11_10630 [Leptolyngbya sp. SIO3F4]|nr:hypothetical protein [Leptolyngbya sp. SIO3F4]